VTEGMFLAGGLLISAAVTLATLVQLIRARRAVRCATSLDEVAAIEQYARGYARTVVAGSVVLTVWVGIWLEMSGGRQGLWIVPVLVAVSLACYRGARATGRRYAHWFLGL